MPSSTASTQNSPATTDLTAAAMLAATPSAAATADPTRRARLKWQADTIAIIDRMALDWDGFAADHDTSFLDGAPDPELLKKQAVVGAYLRAANGGKPVNYDPSFARIALAKQRFNGRGADSDEAFFGEIHREATERKDASELHLDLASTAARHQLLKAAGDPRATESDWLAWKQANAGKPVFSRLSEPDLMSAWLTERQHVAEATAPFEAELSQVWKGFQAGEANFFEIADAIAEDEREDFKTALGMLARALPAEERRGFFANLAKQATRDIGSLPDRAAAGVTREVNKPAPTGHLRAVFGDEAFAEGEAFGDAERFVEANSAAVRERLDFIADLRNIAERQFDPVTPIPGNYIPDTIESGLYASPGVIGTTVLALVPYAGPAASYGILREDIYQSTRERLLADGLSAEQARTGADSIASIAAIPAALLERIGARAVTGRLPAVNRALTRAADTLGRNASTRFITRATGEAAFETATETTQDLMAPLIQDIAAALDEDLPGVTWQNGSDGVLDGFWAQQASTFVAILPLAIIGAASGIPRDRRNAAFAEATDLELRAFGLSEGRIREIREAQGPESLAEAVDTALAERDDTSESAIEATQTIAEEVERTRAAAEDAQASGMLPRFRRTADGWTVEDTDTGAEIGTAPDHAGALRLALAYIEDARETDADEIANLAAMLEAGDIVANENTDTNTTDTTFEPGTTRTLAEAAAESPDQEARVFQQVEAEAALGGDPDLSRIVLGQSQTDFAQGVRHTVNRIFNGSSVLTVFHEDTHGRFRRAIESGTLTRDETVSFLRALDTVLAPRSERGQTLRFLPEGDDITDTQLDEAVSAFMEAEILRTRKGGGKRRLPPGLVSRSLSAIARLTGSKTAAKFASFIRAMRAHFGQVIRRAVTIRRAIDSGQIDAEAYDAFLSKLLNLDDQTDFDQMAREAEAAILDGADAQPLADGDPFSLGPAALADALRADAIGRIKDPERRAKAFQRIARRFDELRLAADRLELVAGSKRLRKSLAREARVREALRREELENQAMARHFGILADEDLVRLKSQPLHEFFSTTRRDGKPDPLHGRLMSRSAAEKAHPDMFRENNPGDYDGADAVSPTVFGGSLMPDQAAQEAHEAGLIREATTDALWEALAREARTVEGMKQALATAKEDLRNARTQAKEETNVWLREQGATQETTFSDKNEILRALAALDAILAAMPAEVRGRVGGYTQLARIGSNENRLAFLREKIAKADRELERWLRIQLDQEFKNLIRRAKPEKSEAGEKPRGKVTPEIHDLFRQVEQAMGMRGPEVEAEAVRLETLAEEDTRLDPDQAEHLRLTAGMIRLAGDWIAADAARREMALVEGTRLFSDGYGQAKIAAAARREARQRRRDTAKAETGSAGTPLELDRAAAAAGTAKGKLRDARFGLYSFHQILQSVFGHDSRTANHFADWERAAADAKADAIHGKMDQLDELLADIAGGRFKGEELRHRLARKTIKAGGRELSELEAITATLMFRQGDGRRHMEGHLDDAGQPVGDWHYGQDFIDQLEAALSPEAKALRLHIAEQYAAEYDRLNAVYRDLYGVNLPRHANYAPITVQPAAGVDKSQQDPVTGQTISGTGFTPGPLRTRSTIAIAEPRFEDALQTYLAHSMQMEHWMAYAPMVTEAMAVLNTREVGNPIKASAGDAALRTLRDWVDYFTTGGNRDAAAFLSINQRFANATNRLAAAALIGRVSVLAIQSTQLGAAAAKMPAASYLKRLAKLITGQLGWSKAMRSDYIQRRMRDMPPALQQAMRGLESSRPNRVKSAVRWLGKSIAGADALFTAGTYAITYDYHVTHAPATLRTAQERADYASRMTERTVDDIAQPVRPGTRSALENRSTNVGMRLLWAFASEGRQKLALSLYATAEKRPPAEIARAYAVTWLVGGAVASIIRAAIRDIRSDDDDEIFDDRNWNPARLAVQSLAGPLQGIPFIGEMAETAGMIATGNRPFPSSTLFDAVGDSTRALMDAASGDIDTLDEALRAGETIANGSAFVSGTGSAATSIFHLIRDLVGIAENIEGPN
ncbi:hypothetical protein [Haloferula sp. A504]|uniref:hypothetical protein n=1 Tax=Haloferula sp. A504 TaxID=3373601 RepID=UPI0031C794B2|nr:hypothetical protein [Verrucomicrobiaceae bacterium E54]